MENILLGLHHTGLHVSDLEKSISFYQDVLGMVVYFQKDVELIKSDRPMCLAFLKSYSGGIVELIGPSDYVASNLACKRSWHLSFFVENLNSAMNHFHSCGIELTLNHDAQGKLRTFSLHDPDGYLIEIMQL